MRLKILSVLVVISITACQSSKHTVIWPPVVSNEVIDLQTAKLSNAKTSTSTDLDVMLKVCIDYNQDTKSPHWVCKGFFVQKPYDYPESEWVNVDFIPNPYEMISLTKTTYIKDRAPNGEFIMGDLSYGVSILANREDKTLSFELSELLSIEVEEKGGEHFIQVPNIIKCSHTIPFVSPGSEGFFGDFCYYDLAEHVKKDKA